MKTFSRSYLLQAFWRPPYSPMPSPIVPLDNVVATITLMAQKPMVQTKPLKALISAKPNATNYLKSVTSKPQPYAI